MRDPGPNAKRWWVRWRKSSSDPKRTAMSAGRAAGGKTPDKFRPFVEILRSVQRNEDRPEKHCASSKPNGAPRADGSPSEPGLLLFNPAGRSWSFRSVGHAN